MAFNIKIGKPLPKETAGRFLTLLGGQVSIPPDPSSGDPSLPTDSPEGLGAYFEQEPIAPTPVGATNPDLVFDGPESALSTTGLDVKVGTIIAPDAEFEPCVAPDEWTNILTMPEVTWCWSCDEPWEYKPTPQAYAGIVATQFGPAFSLVGRNEYDRNQPGSNVIRIRGLDEIFCTEDMRVRVRRVVSRFVNQIDRASGGAPEGGVSTYVVPNDEIADYRTGAGTPNNPLGGSRATWVIEVRKA